MIITQYQGFTDPTKGPVMVDTLNDNPYITPHYVVCESIDWDSLIYGVYYRIELDDRNRVIQAEICIPDSMTSTMIRDLINK